MWKWYCGYHSTNMICVRGEWYGMRAQCGGKCCTITRIHEDEPLKCMRSTDSNFTLNTIHWMLPQWMRTLFVGLFRYTQLSVYYNLRTLTNTLYIRSVAWFRTSNGWQYTHTHTYTHVHCAVCTLNTSIQSGSQNRNTNQKSVKWRNNIKKSSDGWFSA